MVADAEQDAVAGELAAAYHREESLAKDLGRVKAENAELQTKLAKVTASLKNAKVTAREALIEMADQNAKLVQAFVDKKRECKQLKVIEAIRHPSSRPPWEKPYAAVVCCCSMANNTEVSKITTPSCATKGVEDPIFWFSRQLQTTVALNYQSNCKYLLSRMLIFAGICTGGPQSMAAAPADHGARAGAQQAAHTAADAAVACHCSQAGSQS